MKIKYLQGLFLFTFVSFAMAAETVYVSGKAGENEANSYTKVRNLSSRFLAYRDLGRWLGRTKGKSALDYGSGIGFSSDYLLNKGFKVKGADISQDMIARAKKAYPETDFVLIKNSELPFADKTFDLVFSSLVLFEMSSLEKIQQYVEQARRVLKDDGYFIAVTGSSAMHDPEYRSAVRTSNFPENKNARSGALVRVRLNEIGLTLSDYLWFEKDFRQAFAKAGLPICEVHYPLGKKDEGYPWIDELKRSPFILILAAKKCPELQRE